MKKLALVCFVLVGCGSSSSATPALDISRAACRVVQPICRVATTACGFVPDAPTEGGEAP